MSANKAADLHGLPCSTLKDRIRSKVIHGHYPGPEPYLYSEEERELAGYLIKASNIGYGKTRRDVLSLVQTYVEKKEMFHCEVIILCMAGGRSFWKGTLHLVCKLETLRQELEWMQSMLRI